MPPWGGGDDLAAPGERSLDLLGDARVDRRRLVLLLRPRGPPLVLVDELLDARRAERAVLLGRQEGP
eukprot:CAMPEP_0119418256 /NCGR_PEP_ID=MMETSP1335-20130426/17793_1 /TAXON_ID=259385 /ORGANISM="Chrysoculter rhomboideus, Strain RCC1486" /LENGTH=66 /DNA_ID=CAMNT_0007443487 /DNA_START=160 /DNA_END=356 /DNA_ORIENTATION=+